MALHDDLAVAAERAAAFAEAGELAGATDEPRVASAAYLDAVGTSQLGASTGAVEAFVEEVEARYKLPLR